MRGDVQAAMRVEQELFVRALFPGQPPTRVVGQLAAAMRDVTVEREGIIFAAGAPSRTLYLVVGGGVLMQAEGRAPWRFESGAMIGIVDASQGRPYTRTARADPRAQLLAIDYEEYLEILEDNFAFGMGLLEDRCAMLHAQAKRLGPGEVFADDDREGVAQVGRPSTLELDAVERLLVLREVRALRGSPVQPLSTLARSAFVVKARAGDPVFDAEEPSDAIFVVAAGRVTVREGGVEADFGPGSILGSVYALARGPRGYAATAATAASLVVMTREDLYDVIEDHFGVARCLLAWLARENERTRRAAPT